MESKSVTNLANAAADPSIDGGNLGGKGGKMLVGSIRALNKIWRYLNLGLLALDMEEREGARHGQGKTSIFSYYTIVNSI